LVWLIAETVVVAISADLRPEELGSQRRHLGDGIADIAHLLTSRRAVRGSGRILRGVLDELQAVESRVCGSQLVGERMSDLEDRAGLVRFVESLRPSACSIEYTGDQLVDGLVGRLDLSGQG
jgi:hypothetical protein